VYHKVNRKLETGVQVDWTIGSNDTRFSLGAKYLPDKDTTLRAKLNNSSQIALSYQQKIRDGVTLTLSTQVEGKNFNQGGHKFGLGIDFEA
jgi:voltage-dependent anion channel protein 2